MMRILLSTACLILAAGTPCSAAAIKTVTVIMVDDRFQPDHVVFQSGQPTELRLENHGKAMHEFTAPEFLRAAKIQDKRLLANGGTDIVVQAGKAVRIRLTPGPAGDYKLICADHDWDGMTGSITVAP